MGKSKGAAEEGPSRTGLDSSRENPFRTEQWDQSFKVNVRAIWLPSRATLPHMRKAGGGSIINMASTLEIVGRSNPEEPLFLSSEGCRLHPDNFIKRQLKPILKKLSLDGAAHAFRHGNACLLDHLAAPMKVRQDRLGHRRPAYNHGLHPRDWGRPRKVAEQLGDYSPRKKTAQEIETPKLLYSKKLFGCGGWI